ncbi:MAG TPA: hypothetical protein VN688_07860 [Gemmataceae bacterium]|nr:hypothetical protein [Gemmataceae bacterium]
MASAGDMEQLQTVETGWGPASESALLIDLLTCNDPTDRPNDRNPLALVNAYKHRLHALRREYVNARVQTLDHEEQLAESRLHIARLEAHIHHLETTLEDMRSTRVWRAAVMCNRWRRTLSQCLRRICG